MTWRVFGTSVILVGLATLFAGRGELARAEGGGFPRAKQYLQVVLDDAHKRFRKDAVIARIELQGVPGQACLGEGLYSPSNGATIQVTAAQRHCTSPILAANWLQSWRGSCAICAVGCWSM